MRFGNRAIRLYRAGNKDCPTHLLFGGLLGILHILPDKPELCCRTTCVFRESTVRTFRTKDRTINPFTATQQIRQHILIVLHPAETHGTISQRWQVIDIFPSLSGGNITTSINPTFILENRKSFKTWRYKDWQTISSPEASFLPDTLETILPRNRDIALVIIYKRIDKADSSTTQQRNRLAYKSLAFWDYQA